jgi:hypothetical protein
MKLRTVFLTMTALALVTGCSRGGSTNNVAAGNTASNAAAPANTAAPAPAPAGNTAAAEGEGGGTVDAAFLTGRWGINGDCAMTMEFRADGTATPPEGSTYAIEGNVVTVTSPGQAPDPRTVTRTGDDAMTVSGGGQAMNMTRCR